MDTKAVLQELEAAGTAQNRKVYKRHGAREPLFGVSYARLNALKKQIKTDHALARALWKTGNHDARVLATLVADPKQLDEATLEAWAAELDNYMVTDAFTTLASRTPFVRAKAEVWSQSDDEWIGNAGWQLVAHLALKDEALPDACFEKYLDQIEREIHARKNRTRYAMNNALIAIGGRNEPLKDKALKVAERIGPVEVDHGETNCKTPDAIPYIEKMWARKT